MSLDSLNNEVFHTFENFKAEDLEYAIDISKVTTF